MGQLLGQGQNYNDSWTYMNLAILQVALEYTLEHITIRLIRLIHTIEYKLEATR